MGIIVFDGVERSKGGGGEAGRGGDLEKLPIEGQDPAMKLTPARVLSLRASTVRPNAAVSADETGGFKYVPGGRECFPLLGLGYGYIDPDRVFVPDGAHAGSNKPHSPSRSHYFAWCRSFD